MISIALSEKMDKDIVLKDKRESVKKGPVAVGERAVYLNGVFLYRIYYIPFKNISRIYKRVAMSKGGFSGKGIFASIPYLVVEYDNGLEKQCRFKYERDVDEFLDLIKERFPDMPIHSKKAEEMLRRAEIEEMKKFKKDLSHTAMDSWKKLNELEEILEKKPYLYRRISDTARTKRMTLYTGPFYRHLQLLLIAASLISLIAGIINYMKGGHWTVYFILFAFSFILGRISLRVNPTGKDNRRRAENEFLVSIKDMSDFLEKEYRNKEYLRDLVPAVYAHPCTLRRLVRIIREGRAENITAAMNILKRDLKAINSSVKVSKKDYDEIIAIKPIFLSMDYK